MSSFLLAIALVATLFGVPRVWGAEDLEGELSALEMMRDVQLYEVNQPLKELDAKYREALEKKVASAQKAGNLEEVVASKAELRHLADGNGTAALPKQADLARLRQIHREQKARLMPQVEAGVLAADREYGRQLKKLVVDLTKAGKTDEALKVKLKADDLAKELQARQHAKQQRAALSAHAAPGKTMDINLPGGVVMTFCYCPPGEFKMGSPPDEKGRGPREGRANEAQANVRLTKGYWIARTECTQKQWVAIMGGNPSHFKGDDLPVEMVDLNAVNQYLNKLNEAKVLPEGFKAALPTEAQWEYACRAGTKTPYSFGKSLDKKQANFGNRGGRTVAAGTYPSNAWGLHEMHGNVHEWCSNWTGKLTDGDDPTGPSSGEYRTIRGGSWFNDMQAARSANRGLFRPYHNGPNIGFRVVLNAAAGDEAN